MSKYTESEIPQIIEYLNSQKDKMTWYICDECNKIDTDEYPTEIGGPKGRELLVCFDCTRYCEHCEEEYCETVAYMHEDCGHRKSNH